MLKKSPLVALFFILCFSACHPKATALSCSVAKDSVSVANDFTISLLEQVSGEDTSSVFLSPISVAMALHMLLPGAQGETYRVLEQLPALVPDTSEALRIASALWIDPRFPVYASFLQANPQAQVYQQPIQAARVNQWASDHTNGKINQLLSERETQGLSMMLTNAIYFCAPWSMPFQPQATSQELFYPTHAQAHEVAMMHQTAHWLYRESSLCQWISLSYRGGSCYMDVLLPQPKVTMDKLIQGLKSDQITTLMPDEVARVVLSLPRVKMEYTRVLTRDLCAMGLQPVFDAHQADFSRLSSVPSVVDMVKQKTYLRVDESGTEAAAVTAIGMRTLAMREEEKVHTMTVNRPYLMMIRDDKGVILFIGKIADIN